MLLVVPVAFSFVSISDFMFWIVTIYTNSLITITLCFVFKLIHVFIYIYIYIYNATNARHAGEGNVLKF